MYLPVPLPAFTGTGDCDTERLNEASDDFIRHLSHLHEEHGNHTCVFLHLQYTKFRLTVLRERYHNNGQSHLVCYCHVVELSCMWKTRWNGWKKDGRVPETEKPVRPATGLPCCGLTMPSILLNCFMPAMN